MHPKVLGIIPARFASTRFPGKPLVEIDGISMIQRVYQQVQQSEYIGKVMVATDDQRILEHVQGFGGVAVMTADHHPSGTDRCAEVACLETDFDIIVNIQGDEPFIQPIQIDNLIQLLINSTASIATLSKKIEKNKDFINPNIVKVVFNTDQKAMYFSRSSIPFDRNNENSIPSNAFKHIGIYAFKRTSLLKITQLKSSVLEQIESLEQLRWLENGYDIIVGQTELETIGIDTPEDLEKLTNRKI